MKIEKYLNALNELMMDDWEYKAIFLEIIMNESGLIIHDDTKELVDKAINKALKESHRFSFRIDVIKTKIKMGCYTDEAAYNKVMGEFAEHLKGNIAEYNTILEQLGANTTVQTRRGEIRKHDVREI